MKLMIKQLENENGIYYIGFIHERGIVIYAKTLPEIQKNLIDAITSLNCHIKLSK